MSSYREFHQRSIKNRDGFWAGQAQRISWYKPAGQVCDFSHLPFVLWFKGSETNLCHNTVDRHVTRRPDDRARVHVPTEAREEKEYSFAELQREVERMRPSIWASGADAATACRSTCR